MTVITLFWPCARKNTFKNLVLVEDDCRITNNLFSVKLCKIAGHRKNNWLVKILSRITQPHAETPLCLWQYMSMPVLCFKHRSPIFIFGSPNRELHGEEITSSFKLYRSVINISTLPYICILDQKFRCKQVTRSRCFQQLIQQCKRKGRWIVITFAVFIQAVRACFEIVLNSFHPL